jgi:hypothetical protein
VIRRALEQCSVQPAASLEVILEDDALARDVATEYILSSREAVAQ